MQHELKQTKLSHSSHERQVHTKSWLPFIRGKIEGDIKKGYYNFVDKVWRDWIPEEFRNPHIEGRESDTLQREREETDKHIKSQFVLAYSYYELQIKVGAIYIYIYIYRQTSVH